MWGRRKARAICRVSKSWRGFSLTSDADVYMQIKAATSAFGALKNALTCLSVNLRVKGRIYSALVSSILLYGSKAWCLREDIINQSRSFHNRCVRSTSASVLSALTTTAAY
jgi:hypothetical protein